ncbi:alanine racemase [bacterium]|nr:alanine racemase [bacterium]
MGPSHRGTRIEIRAHLIHENLEALKKIAGSGFFCPMVKANAYGHGVENLIEPVKALGIKDVGVATLDEAIELRSLQYDRNILLFSRIHKPTDAQKVKEAGITPVVSRFEDLALLEKVSDSKIRLSVHVKFDTGIHRMGFALSEVEPVFDFFKNSKALQLGGLLTHMSHGEDVNLSPSKTKDQLKKFEGVLAHFSSYELDVHCLNSMAMLGLSQGGQDISNWGSRPGIAIYGAIPDERLSKQSVMRVVSQIDHVQRVPQGEGVSYGWSWVAQKDSLVGVIPMGYADGYPRGLANKGEVLILGQRAPLVGNICMDYSLVDLSDLSLPPNLGLDEEVVLLGEQGSQEIKASELAAWNDTISYEMLTGLGIKKNRLEVHS